MFTLISVNKKTEVGSSVQLELGGNPFFPRNFKAEDYKKRELKIYGIKEENEFIEKVSQFIGEYIDVEELENKKLDFWSDGYQIGEFEFYKYEEIVSPFQNEDWIAEHKSLIDYFHRKSDSQTKDNIRWRKFIENLEFFLKKDIENSEAKNEFLKDKREVVNENKMAIKLANKILNLIEQYKIEEKES